MEILMAAGVPGRREGGVAAIVHNLGRELEARGHRVSYLFYDDLLKPSESTGRFRDSLFAVRLAQYLRRNRRKYSIVNLHAPVGFVYGLMRRLSPSTQYPAYVMTLHGLFERYKHVMRREAKKGRAFHFSWKNRLWYRAYHQSRFYLAIMTANRAHCYSRDVETLLLLKYDRNASDVAYIANGVERRFFTDRDYPDRRPVRLLYAGTWLDQRGIFYLKDALRGLNAHTRDWTLTVAGPGVPADVVKDFFGEPLASQIAVLPVVDAEHMPHLYLDHDVFVFPSLMEGLPSVLLEAMASGMPVITADTCGMMDMVEDDFNGLLVPPADAISLEEALRQVCQSPELRRRLGTAAQQTMQRHTWQKSAAKLEKLFLSALSASDAQPAGEETGQ